MCPSYSPPPLWSSALLPGPLPPSPLSHSYLLSLPLFHPLMSQLLLPPFMFLILPVILSHHSLSLCFSTSLPLSVSALHLHSPTSSLSCFSLFPPSFIYFCLPSIYLSPTHSLHPNSFQCFSSISVWLHQLWRWNLFGFVLLTEHSCGEVFSVTFSDSVYIWKKREKKSIWCLLLFMLKWSTSLLTLAIGLLFLLLVGNHLVVLVATVVLGVFIAI